MCASTLDDFESAAVEALALDEGLIHRSSGDLSTERFGVNVTGEECF